MQVNTDIYGAQDTWTRDTGFNYADTPLQYCFKKGRYNTLKDYVNAGKLSIGEEIDYSICYAGMAAGLPLSKLRTWVVLQTGESVNDYDIFMYLRDTPTGWYWGHATEVASTFSFIEGSPIILDGRQTAAYRLAPYYWIPDGQLTTDTRQGSQNIIPIVDFNPHSCYFGIAVEVFNRQSGVFSTYYLDDMYGHTFTTYDVIVRAWGELWVRRGDNDTNYGTASSLCGVCPDRLIDFGQGSIPYLSYTYNLQHNIPLFGWLDTRPSSVRFTGDTLYTVYKRPFYSVSDDGIAGTSQYFCDTLYDTVYNTRDTTSYNYIVECYAPITPANLERLRQCAAAYGLFFTEKNPNTLYNIADRWDSEDMFLGVLDDDGIGWGEYTRGEGNADNPIYGLSSSQSSPYDHKTPIDPNEYSDTTDWNNVNYQTSMTRRYQLTAAQVGELAGEMWDMMAAKPADIDQQNYTLDECLVNNPIDTIISLKYFPCIVETAANPAVVHLGKYQTNISCQAVGTSVKVIDFAPMQVWRHFDDFRDFEPYTTLQMYIPFCGTVSIPTAEAMGKYVSVKLCIDVATGACCGYVIVSRSGSGGICVASATGTAAIDMPVSGIQSANLSQAVFNATANWTNTQISNGKIVAGVLQAVSGQTHGTIGVIPGLYKLGIGASDILSSRSAGGAASLVDKLNPMRWMTNKLKEQQAEKKAMYDLTHIELPMRLIGSSSPVLSSVIESQCRLIIYRPVTDESALSQYADTVGYATVSSGTVSQYSGYTTGTIDVRGINATAEEKEAISAAFASGVYL